MNRAISLDGDLPVAATSHSDAVLDDRMPDFEKATVARDNYTSCRHRSIVVDEKQRVVRCGACNVWLDPVWVLQELIHHYETRVDQRLANIKAFEKRVAEQDARRQARKQPGVLRAQKRATRQQELERAAHNRYQAELLKIRADEQEKRAAKLADEIAALGKGGA